MFGWRIFVKIKEFIGTIETLSTGCHSIKCGYSLMTSKKDSEIVHSSKKNQQWNDHKMKEARQIMTDNTLTYKATDWSTQTPLKTGDKLKLSDE